MGIDGMGRSGTPGDVTAFSCEWALPLGHALTGESGQTGLSVDVAGRTAVAQPRPWRRDTMLDLEPHHLAGPQPAAIAETEQEAGLEARGPALAGLIAHGEKSIGRLVLHGRSGTPA
jgi:hypothetical protein